MAHWEQFFTLTTEKGGGQPCLRRNGMLLADVLDLLAVEPDADKLAAAHPELSKEEIAASIAYVADRDPHDKIVKNLRAERQPLPFIQS
jgi:uncharacterized protein (DUF433 family)